MTYIREGVSHVSPYLIVSNPHQLVEFLITVFDAELIFQQDDATGQPLHVEVQIKDSTIMIGRNEEDKMGINPSMLHIYVQDAEQVMQTALDNGATLVSEIREDTAAGDRRGMVQGPQGNYWAIATRF